MFDQNANRVMMSSIKALHGYLIGGTGTMGLLACTMALRHDVIAPTIGGKAPDPDRAQDVGPNTAREARMDAVLSSDFAVVKMGAVPAL